MKLTATRPIRHDGKDYEPGASFECSERQAQALMDAGAAESAAEKSKGEKGGKD